MSYEIISNKVGPRRHDMFEWERYQLPTANSNVYFSLFCPQTIDFISKQITERLAYVHPEGKNIIVSDTNIISVLDSMYQNYKRDVEPLIMMTISFIVETIKTEYEMEEYNRQLNIWVTTFPESNTLRQYAPIKLREKRPTNFEFHYTY